MRLPFLLIALLFLPLSAQAEAIALRDALREAGERHPQVLQAEAGVAAARAQAAAARSQYLPRVGVAETYTLTDEPGSAMFLWLNQEKLEVSPDASTYNQPPTRHDFQTQVWLRQPLFDPDIAYGRRRSVVAVDGQAAQTQWLREGRALAALQAYVRVQQAQGAQAVAASARREAQEVLRLAREHRQAGTGLKSDELQAQVALAAAERQQLQAGNALRLAGRALALALGRPGGDVTIAGAVSAEDIPSPQTAVPGERPDLLALTARLDDAALAVGQGRAARWPRAQLSAAYNLHDEAPFGSEGRSFSVQAGLTWELYDGGQRQARLQQALAQQQGARQQWIQHQRELALALETARLHADEARALQALDRQSLAQAEENQRLLKERYAAGLASLSDTLRAQTLLDQSRQQLLASEVGLVEALAVVLYENGSLLQQMTEEH